MTVVTAVRHLTLKLLRVYTLYSYAFTISGMLLYLGQLFLVRQRGYVSSQTFEGVVYRLHSSPLSLIRCLSLHLHTHSTTYIKVRIQIINT